MMQRINVSGNIDVEHTEEGKVRLSAKLHTDGHPKFSVTLNQQEAAALAEALLPAASQPEEEPGREAAESWAESERLNFEQRYLAAARITARDAALEEAAKLVEALPIELTEGDPNQEIPLHDTITWMKTVRSEAAKKLRSLAEAKRGSGG